MCECIACMCVYGSCVQCLQKPEEGDRTPGTGFRDVCALPVGSENQTWLLFRSREVLLSDVPYLN